MSETTSSTAPSSARDDALSAARDFLTDWRRFTSIAAFVEVAALNEVNNMKEGEENLAFWVTKEVADNICWLRSVVDKSAQNFAKKLAAAGFAAEQRV
jgi:hypothetical protein